MAKVGFNLQSFGETAGDMESAKMRREMPLNARPTIVTLESGIQAIIEVAGLA